MVHAVNSGHPGGSLGCTEFLVSLYFKVMDHNPKFDMKPKFNLEDLKRENVYNVPEHYFDKLPNRIMQRVTASPEVSETKSWLPARLLINWMAKNILFFYGP